MEQHACNCERCQHKLCTGRVPIFSTLNAEELGRVTDLIIRKQYAKGQRIIMEDTYSESLIIINNGQVKAYKHTQEGKEHILYIFSDGDFFGEKNLLRNYKSTYNAEALVETNVCTINKKEFQQLMREYPEIGFKIMEELCNRLENLENAIQNMGTKNVEARISAVLLEFAEKNGKQHPKGILTELPLSREGIANYIGLTRETVSRKMSLLQDEGIIEMIGNKKLLILDIKKLKASIE